MILFGVPRLSGSEGGLLAGNFPHVSRMRSAVSGGGLIISGRAAWLADVGAVAALCGGPSWSSSARVWRDHDRDRRRLIAPCFAHAAGAVTPSPATLLQVGSDL